MDSFEDLGLSEALVEGLAAEGAEGPTALQVKAIPVLSRGNDLVLRAGPGSGVMAAYGAPILQRLDPEAGGIQALVLTSDMERAQGVAESMARLAQGLGMAVAALAPNWASPLGASVLVAPVGGCLRALESGFLDLTSLKAVVVDGAWGILQSGGETALDSILSATPEGCQKVVTSLPVTPEVHALVGRFLRRATEVPPRVAEQDSSAPGRGQVDYRVVSDDRLNDAVTAVADLLEGGATHVLTFTRTEDGAADLGDVLVLHGFSAGSPGDPECEVWLGVEALDGRTAITELEVPESVATLSVDPAADTDSFDRRHGVGGPGLALVLPRELPHLREVASDAGYQLRRFLPATLAAPAPAAADEGSEEEAPTPLPRQLLAVLETRKQGQAHPDLPDLLARFGAEVVARAATQALLNQNAAAEAAEVAGGKIPGVPSWVKIFLTVGEKDGLKTGDILGAITGETDLPANRVGRIEIKDTFSRVEVHQEVAAEVVEALNGTSIRGRAVRADYDRDPREKKPPRGRVFKGRPSTRD